MALNGLCVSMCLYTIIHLFILCFRWWGKSDCPDLTKPSADETAELQIDNVAGIFIVLIGGSILAAITCLIERLVTGKERTKQQVPVNHHEIFMHPSYPKTSNN